jgi:hypothetical protein
MTRVDEWSRAARTVINLAPIEVEIATKNNGATLMDSFKLLFFSSKRRKMESVRSTSSRTHITELKLSCTP